MINCDELMNVSPTSQILFFDWEMAFNQGEKIVGGKAWNLGRLQRYGFNVPEGGVLPTSIYTQFINDNEISDLICQVSKTITLQNVNDDETCLRLSNIQDAIQQGSFSSAQLTDLTTVLDEQNLLDKPLAVRSSASAEDSDKASFAGIHESFLNVNGIDKIVEAVKSCFASIWTTRAVAYRRKMKVDDKEVLPAVIIMELVDADAAGVAFSCDPASGREDVCLVNANFGLGESVVNGSVEPDTYLINRYTCVTEDKYCGKKQRVTRVNKDGGTSELDENLYSHWVLSSEQQKNLGMVVSRIFSALSASDVHQDIEWVIKDNVFYVLQARPVTVLPRYTTDVLSDQPDIWSNSNFRDALPMVVPVVQRDANVYLVNKTILASFNEFGLKIKPGLSIGKLIGGRLYFNTGLYQRLIYNSVGMQPEDFNLFSGGHQPNIKVPSHSPFSGIAGVKRIIRMIKYAGSISREYKQQHQLYTKIDKFVVDFKQTKLANLTNQEFLNLLRSTEQCLLDFMDRYMLLCAGIGPFGMAIKSLKKVFGDEAIGVVSALATGRGDLPSANQVYDLLEVAEIARDDSIACRFLEANKFSNDDWHQLPSDSLFKQAFERYLDKYGYRAIYEADMSEPRWHEDSSYLLSNIAKSMATANLKEHKQRQRQLYDEAVVRLRENVGFFKNKWVLKLVKDAVQGADTRETAKAYSVKMFELTRLIYLEAGQRLYEKNVINESSDIFYCSRSDVLTILDQQWTGDGLKSLVEDRKKELEVLIAQDAPDVVINNENIFKKSNPVRGNNTFQGIGVSAGQVEGVSRCIGDPREGLNLKQGEILIAPSTDPSWTPLFLNAAGIVLETGGYTSHGSIVAREYGIPAVVNVPGALKLLRVSQVVLVNGDNGSVILK